MKRKLCSFLVPTRYRVESLKKMIKSFRYGADDVNCFDFIIKVDQDDTETIAAVPEIEKLHESITFIMNTKVGYQYMEHYVTMLSHCTDAVWAGMIADDIYLTEGRGWDSKLAQVETYKKGKGFFVAPEISQIGASTLGRERTPDIGPAFVENRIWEKFGWDKILYPPDMSLYRLLVDCNKFTVKFLEGIRLHHPDHAPDDKLVISQGRQGQH